jgi:hypothetical protein
LATDFPTAASHRRAEGLISRRHYSNSGREAHRHCRRHHPDPRPVRGGHRPGPAIPSSS